MSLYCNGIADIYDATRAMPPEVDEQITEFIRLSWDCGKDCIPRYKALPVQVLKLMPGVI
jgi:bacterioferritin-associated ferredoxin